MTEFTFPRCSSQSQWPSLLAKDFASIMTPLFAQGALISLERLQLITIIIALDDKTPASGSIVKDASLLSVAKNFSLLDDAKMVKCTAQFFVRGQRQFFRHPDSPLLLNRNALSAITIADIVNMLGSDNSALVNKDLAQLAGRREINVPSQMVMALCLDYALFVVDDAQREPTFYELHLSRAVNVGDALKIAHVVNADGGVVVQLFANDQLAVSLTAQ